MVHAKRNILNTFPLKLRPQISLELKEVFAIETDFSNQVEGYEKVCSFVSRWEKKYPSLKSYSKARNTAFFTYLEYPSFIQRMIYSTNWVERLNKDYRRVLKMRGAMPSADSVIALMGAAAMEKDEKTYKYPVWAFREVEELKRKIMKYYNN